MSPTSVEISAAMDKFLKGQIWDIIILSVLLIVFCIVMILYMRKESKRKNKIGACILTAVIALGIIIISAYKFIPAYMDHTQNSYIIADDVDIFVHEQSSTVFFDNYDDIDIITADGEKIPLKMYLSNSLNKKETYRGTVVYTVNSKAIIWYEVE